MRRIALILLLLPVQVQAAGRWADRYVCTFPTECVGAHSCIDSAEPERTVLDSQGDTWTMTGADGSVLTFQPVAGASEELLSLVAAEADADAGAVALFSLSRSGQAFVTLHGIFLTPEVVTHIGICKAEDGS